MDQVHLSFLDGLDGNHETPAFHCRADYLLNPIPILPGYSSVKTPVTHGPDPEGLITFLC